MLGAGHPHTGGHLPPGCLASEGQRSPGQSHPCVGDWGSWEGAPGLHGDEWPHRWGLLTHRVRWGTCFLPNVYLKETITKRVS